MVGFEWLSLYNSSAPGVFQHTESFMYSERQLKQQKIEILSKFMSSDSKPIKLKK